MKAEKFATLREQKCVFHGLRKSAVVMLNAPNVSGLTVLKLKVANALPLKLKATPSVGLMENVIPASVSVSVRVANVVPAGPQVPVQ